MLSRKVLGFIKLADCRKRNNYKMNLKNLNKIVITNSEKQTFALDCFEFGHWPSWITASKL